MNVHVVALVLNGAIVGRRLLPVTADSYNGEYVYVCLVSNTQNGTMEQGNLGGGITALMAACYVLKGLTHLNIRFELR